MSYLSQIIVFALALMGTLFQSTKTDADGKTLHTKSGLPVLTTVGKVVVTLLTISFGISLLSVWQSEQAESEARENARVAAQKLANVEQYNRGIDDTVKKVEEAVKKVLGQNETLTKEQRDRFATVLDEQEKGGKELAGRLSASADLLQSRIESSSDILRGRIDSSIDVLKLTAGNIASLADPIRAINVNILVLEVPVTHPALEGYRRRLEAGIREFRALPDDFARRGHYRLAEGWSVGNLKGIAIWPGSPLLPDPYDERAASTVLTEADMDILLYRTPQSAERLAGPSPPDADIEVWVKTCMKRLRRPQGGGPCDVDRLPEFDNFTLAYDPDSRRAFLFIFNFKLGPPSSLPRQDSSPPANEWSKRPGGRINGSPDLAGSQVVTRVRPLYANLPPGYDNTEDFEAIDEIRRQIRLARLSLVVSDQFSFYYSPNETLESRGSSVVMRMTQRADEKGFPFYFYTLPNTLLNPTR